MNGELHPLLAGSPAPAIDWTCVAPAPQRAADCVLLCFLPLAGAPVCTADVKSLAEAAALLRAWVDAIVVASVDSTAHLRRFLDEQGGSALAALGDPELALARAYGVAWPQRFAARASFLLGSDRHGGLIVRASAVHPIAFSRRVDVLTEWCSRG